MRGYLSGLVVFLCVAASASVASAATIIRYGTNAPAFNPGDAATYTEIPSASWGNLNTAISNAINATTRGFVYTSGDLTGAGATTGPIRIIGNTGAAGFELKGGFNSAFTAQDYLAKSILNANATGSSLSRVLVIGADNVTVDGFKITGGYTGGGNEPGLTFTHAGIGGAGIAAEATGLRLSHLEVSNNTVVNDWKVGGGIFVAGKGSATVRLEYLVVSGNVNQAGSGWAWGGGLYVSSAVSSTYRLMVANSRFSNNSANGSSANCGDGAAVFLHNGVPAGNYWTLFGCLFDKNIGNGNCGAGLSIQGGGSGGGWGSVVNSTVVTNKPISIGNEGGVQNWMTQNVFINSAIADNGLLGGLGGAGVGICYGGPNDDMRFRYCLIDEVSNRGSSTNGAFFNTTEPGAPYNNSVMDGGGNQQVTNCFFIDQAAGDYRLQPNSPGFGAGLARYDSRGFAYVDINKNDSYDAGIDVIVDRMNRSTYTVTGADYYYPTDLNEIEWIRRTSYGSDADLAGMMNIGAFATRQPRGMIVYFR